MVIYFIQNIYYTYQHNIIYTYFVVVLKFSIDTESLDLMFNNLSTYAMFWR